MKRIDLNIDEIRDLIQGKSVKEVKKLICGKFINAGVYRRVYICKVNPKYVVKIESNMSSAAFNNVCEWRNYIDTIEWKDFSKWLAPCVMINETGQVLIQERVYHKKRKDYPKYIPNLFCDTKLSNFGWIEDNFVCCDYAFFTRFDYRMKYAKWHGSLKNIDCNLNGKQPQEKGNA